MVDSSYSTLDSSSFSSSKLRSVTLPHRDRFYPAFACFRKEHSLTPNSLHPLEAVSAQPHMDLEHSCWQLSVLIARDL
jgi:hypothetical protein